MPNEFLFPLDFDALFLRVLNQLQHSSRTAEKNWCGLKEDQDAREAGILEPNAMSLATSGGDGMPDIRTVLLKYFDDAGFVFYTNYGSRKAHELAENPTRRRAVADAVRGA